MRLASVLPARMLARNTTAIDNHVGWVSAGNDRSTLDILFSCFSILLICTYKCIHFNVPSLGENNAKWFTQRWWRKRLKKLGWMMFIVLVPELGVAIAMDQYLLAREQCYTAQKVTRKSTKKNESTIAEREEEEDVEKIAMEVHVDEMEEQEITKTHIFFANMGGFNLRICSLYLPEEDDIQRKETPPDDITPIEHTIGVVDKSATLCEFSFPLEDWDDLDHFRGLFPDLKIPTEEELSSLSKADAFTKAFACIQSGWLIIQSIARLCAGLPITQLELATMAFVVCALIMYLLWWHKPFGVEHRTTITVIVHKESDKKELVRYLTGYSRYSVVPDSFFEKILGVQSAKEILKDAEFDNFKTIILRDNQEYYKKNLDLFHLGGVIFETGDLTGEYLRELGKAIWIMVRGIFGSTFIQVPREYTGMLAFYATGFLFSAFHIAAWNWEFPSSATRELWRTFAVTATATGLVTIIINFMFDALEDSYGIPEILARTVIFGLPFIYIVSRTGLVVLIFYSFSSMPAEVYQTVNWVQFLPHFS